MAETTMVSVERAENGKLHRREPARHVREHSGRDGPASGASPWPFGLVVNDAPHHADAGEEPALWDARRSTLFEKNGELVVKAEVAGARRRRTSRSPSTMGHW